MWPRAQQPPPLAQRFGDQAELAMLQVSQPAVNNAGGPAGSAAGEIILLQQQRALARARALARDGDAIDAAADHRHIEALAVEGGSDRLGHLHALLRWSPELLRGDLIANLLSPDEAPKPSSRTRCHACERNPGRLARARPLRWPPAALHQAAYR